MCFKRVRPLSLDRLQELSSTDSDIAPSDIEMHGVKYIRSEYFTDGQRIFFSPLDFALNGPDDGSVMEREHKLYGRCKVKVLKRHFERGSEIPSFIECEVSRSFFKHKLWVVVRTTKLVLEKFPYNSIRDIYQPNYALYPDIYLKKNLRMDLVSPRNDASIAFSLVTGIPTGTKVREELL